MRSILTHDDDEITVAAFTRWLRVARKGDAFVYHRGNLAADREDVQMLPALGTFVSIRHEPAHELGTIARHHYERGDITLAQKRLPDSRGFAYFAFKL